MLTVTAYGEVSSLINEYVNNDIFAPRDDNLFFCDNPYRRQLLPGSLKSLDFSGVLPVSQLLSYRSLAARRILNTIYEADFVLLPKASWQYKHDDFSRFYDLNKCKLGESIRHALEEFCFGFLEREIEVSGGWDEDSLLAFVDSLRLDKPSEATCGEKAVLNSPDPRRAARMWLLQFAPDALSEASSMIRNLLGSFGPAQANWFKVVIDEYGYGVYDRKHSRPFEEALVSVGLRPDLHYYWQYYLASSLLMSNYFQYLGKNHRFVFRYLGAQYYFETVGIPWSERGGEILSEAFKGQVDIEYFQEHAHIDHHHSRMVIKDVIRPILELCGDGEIHQVVRGIKEAALIVDLADRDVAEQITWMDSLEDIEAHEAPSSNFIKRERLHGLGNPIMSPMRSHDERVCIRVTSGSLRLHAGLDCVLTLKDGQAVEIPKNRLYGLESASNDSACTYHPLLVA